MVKEIQGHMRLRSSGDRHETRQQYIPVLWSKLIKRLEVEGKESVPKIIDLMDSYYLTKDDFDAISELGVGYMDQETIKIETQAKATFTRTYNTMSHPMPFMKASSVLQPKKQSKDKPDLEEALEESDEGEVIDEAADKQEDDDDGDLTKDKYIKAPKKKRAAPAATKGKKKKDADVNMEEGSDEAPKPKKAKGKGKAKK
jgi:replication factor C subunit 1